MTRVWATPVFVGETEDGDRIVIYRDRSESDTFHIRVGDGELMAIPPGSTVSSWHDPINEKLHVDITSLVWKGKATGDKRAVLYEEALRR